MQPLVMKSFKYAALIIPAFRGSGVSDPLFRDDLGKGKFWKRDTHSGIRIFKFAASDYSRRTIVKAILKKIFPHSVNFHH